MTRSRWLRLLVAVGLTAIVLYKSHPADVLRAGAHAQLAWIGAAVLLVLVDRTLMAYRWLVLLCGLTPGTRPPFGAVLRIFFVSTFVGTFLPSIGGDLYRAYSLAKLQVRGVESAASVIMDRILGVLSILILGIAALCLAPRLPLDRWAYLTLALAAVFCAIAALVVFSDRAASAAQRLAARVPSASIHRLSTSLIDVVRRYGRFHRELAQVLAFSVIVQILRVLEAYCLGRALNIGAGLPAYFVFIPVILLIMLLPITVSGLGTSQAAFVWLFGQAAVPAAAAFALSILFVALSVVGNLPGALLYASGPAFGADARPS
ncbi:MAG TPA: lysylphosphatidylglycerol synthase transmembrane domain-containing protein [Vicinamibacterales bacterium]|nr:lysylphosphatidylglycerol synthase transmembrane domain-containing protein [Vicinamibacterales bacterium]